MKITGMKFNSNSEMVLCDGLVLGEDKKLDKEKSDMKIVEYLQGLPRVTKYEGSTAPRVKLEDGKEIALSYKFYTKEEKEVYKSYKKEHSNGTGSGGVSTKKKDLDKHARVILGLPEDVLKKIPKDTLEFLKNECLVEDTKVAQAKKLLAGMTPEQIEMMKAMFAQA